MELLDLRDMQQLLKVKATAVYSAVRRNHIPKPIKVGGSSRWIKDEVEAALRRRASEREA